MKTEKADQFQLLVRNAAKLLKDFDNTETEDLPSFDFQKEKFSEQVFEDYRQAFMFELRDNIYDYREFNIIEDYIHASFSVLSIVGIDIPESNYWYINRKVESSYLIKLRQRTEETANWLILLNNSKNRDLYLWYRKILDDEERLFESEQTHAIMDPEPINPAFVFDNLKEELKALPHAVDKIKFINARLCDYKQWELKSLTDFTNKPLADKFYPQFEAKCKIETTFLNNEIEIDQKAVANLYAKQRQTQITNPFAEYAWAVSQTDLLELIASLHLCKAIVRRDGKAITRAELVDNFGKLFQIEIKEAESKLGKATDRKSPTASFTYQMQQAFANYCNKEDKPIQKKVVKFR